MVHHQSCLDQFILGHNFLQPRSSNLCHFLSHNILVGRLTFFSLEQLPSSTTPSISTLSFITTSFTIPFMTPLVTPIVALIIPFFVAPFDLPFYATSLFPTYAHPYLSGNSLNVDSSTSSKKVID